MRPRDRILANLESAYREAFEAARARDDRDEMARLDFEFQRDQIHLEVLLDLRALLSSGAGGALPAGGASGGAGAATGDAEPKKERTLLEEGAALVEKAEALKRIVRLR